MSKFKRKTLASHCILALPTNDNTSIKLNPMSFSSFINQPTFSVGKGGSCSKIHQMASLFNKRKPTQNYRKNIEDIEPSYVAYHQPLNRDAIAYQKAFRAHTEVSHQISSLNQRKVPEFNNIEQATCSVGPFKAKGKGEGNHRHQRTLNTFMPSLMVQNEEWTKRHKSRNLYMKTGEGRRAKIDPYVYFKKIQQKLADLTTPNLVNSSNESSECHHHEPNRTRRTNQKPFLDSLRGKKTKTVKVEEFRPWSSCNSEAID